MKHYLVIYYKIKNYIIISYYIVYLLNKEKKTINLFNQIFF
jgi:hypothetical protein